MAFKPFAKKGAKGKKTGKGKKAAPFDFSSLKKSKKKKK